MPSVNRLVPLGGSAELLALTPVSPAEKRALLVAGPDSSQSAGSTSAVSSSWRRSQALGADQDGRAALSGAIADPRTLRDARERAEHLRRAAASVLDGFAAACSANHFVAIVADAHGIVLDTLGGGAFEAEARRLRLVPGSDWREAVRGTNAIGTALAEGRPVAVYGNAHYAHVNEGLVCIAAPIFDPRGALVGVLDATSFASEARAFDPGVVVTVARAIEEVLRAREYVRGASDLDLVERLIDRARDPAFLIERPGRIVRANASGRQLASTPMLALLTDWRFLQSHAGRTVDCSQYLGPQLRAELEASIEPILDQHGERLALLVFLRVGATYADVEVDVDARQRRAARAPEPEPFSAAFGSDAALVAARSTSQRLARTRLPILLLAETGTGKELFARGIHSASARAAGPFVPVNCGAIQKDLFLSELFGHGPSAFTGAARGGRDGLIAAADGGTLFLDEVADLAPDAQVALLRVLEDGSYTRVGESSVRHADLRIVAATSQDLSSAVREGRFRQDLYFRISGATIPLPPLRSRTDLHELIDHLWSRVRTPQGLRPAALDLSARAALAAHRWPGNVRELESALEFAAALAEGAPIATAAHLPPSIIRGARGALGADLQDTSARDHSQAGGLDSARRDALVRALREAHGNVSAAARALGVARSTVYRMARKLGLEVT